jgi:hypothetical protein
MVSAASEQALKAWQVSYMCHCCYAHSLCLNVALVFGRNSAGTCGFCDIGLAGGLLQHLRHVLLLHLVAAACIAAGGASMGVSMPMPLIE